MKKTLLTTAMTLLLATGFILPVTIGTAQAQRYAASEGYITFYSEATVEDIEAKNEKIQSIFDTESGKIAYIVPIREFMFDKNLMRKHFNENYMHTEKYPEATFTGTLEGFTWKEGTQEVTAKGKLTIHGITKEVEHTGTVTIEGNKMSMHAEFPVVLEEYEVERPKLLWKNIAEEVLVTVHLNYAKQ